MASDTFEEQYCEMLIEHMSRGLSFQSFAGKIGVCKKTLDNWVARHDSFLRAKEIGRAKGLLYDELLLTNGTEGKVRGYNISAHKWKMANMYRWTERVEQTHMDLTKEETDALKRELLLLSRELE